MISDGQNYYNPQQMTQSPYGQNPYGQYPQYPQQQQGPMFQPITLPSRPGGGRSGPKISLTGSVDSIKSTPGYNAYMIGGAINDGLGAITDMMSTVFNYQLASDAMGKQLEIANKYYDTQLSIAKLQQGVANNQIGLQKDALKVQKEMHKDQINHEENLARIAGDLEQKLAIIDKDKTVAIAQTMSAADAFGRRAYSNMGLPRFGLSGAI